MEQPPKTAIYIQDRCYRHSWIRTRDASHIFERPERLRAVKLGLAAAIAHLEELVSPRSSAKNGIKPEPEGADELANALENMKLAVDQSELPVSVVLSSASVELLNNPAVKFVHGDIDGDVYLENLVKWARESRDNIASVGSEIPEGYNQGDMYLCPESIDAMQGALGTTCEAVDTIMNPESPVSRAFVAIRPPGHHCGEDTPAGFCFVNNVAVGAAHAHLQHGIKRVVILDIDLHHGNGTQSIVWQINEETYRETLESEAGSQSAKPGPQIYYGSLHDILSYPCEDGKTDLVQAASVSIHDAHGQNIENIHLRPYANETEFWKIYEEKYTGLINRAEQFLDRTGGPGDDVLIFMSTGMDACEHEYEAMSRHGRKVPTSFYHRFTVDTRAFADKYSRGRLISVLEGGYSDRALTSASFAHFSGLASDDAKREWWDLENLIKIETKANALKKKRGGRASLQSTAAESNEPWLDRTVTIFSSILDVGAAGITIMKGTTTPVPSSDRTLRDRTKKPASTPASPVKPESRRAGRKSGGAEDVKKEQDVPKKLPRVILKLGPKPEEP